MLGDLKGTKYLIESNQLETLRERITTINEIFANSFMKEKTRSRSLKCFSFSDSILAIWESDYEGRKYSANFSLSIWHAIAQRNYPYRIFIDIGTAYDDNDSLSSIISKNDTRFEKIFPIAVPIWSVFYAEGSRFPEGVFVGERLIDRIDNLAEFELKPFKFYKIS